MGYNTDQRRLQEVGGGVREIPELAAELTWHEKGGG